VSCNFHPFDPLLFSHNSQCSLMLSSSEYREDSQTNSPSKDADLG
jgi:hypothetical protein